MIHLRTIHKYFVSLLKDHRHTLYERDTPFKGDKDEKQLLDVSQRRFDVRAMPEYHDAMCRVLIA